MDTKTIGLLGAVTALSTVGSAQASIQPSQSDPLKAESYADLLRPIPNAIDLLRADNAALKERAALNNKNEVEVAQYYHHHHHHHRFFRPFYRHHHHHHRYMRHHHHHHHHFGY